jgi:hypothetical protein
VPRRALRRPAARAHPCRGRFALRSVDPPLSAAEGRRVLGVRRLGKRIVFELEGDLFLSSIS